LAHEKPITFLINSPFGGYNTFQIELLRSGRKVFRLHKKIENSYLKFRNKYLSKSTKYLKIADISFLGAYMAATALDASFTLGNIRSPDEESHLFTSFMMQKYGVLEGLIRVQGIEALQLAVLLGFSYILTESWRLFRREEIDTEVRLCFLYVYMAIGISKHIQGILSWL